MKMKISAAALAAWFALSPALAQPPPVTPPPFSVLAGGLTLSATTSSGSSSRTALPKTLNPYSAVTLYNSGTIDGFWAIGDNTVVATTSPTGLGSGTNSGKIKAGTYFTLWANNTNIAVITASSTTTIEVYQGSGPIQFGNLNGSGGGGGGVTSVFGRTGVVTAQSGDYDTSLVTENGNLYFTNARAIAAPLTGYVSGAGTVAATDSILQAIQKINGNVVGLACSAVSQCGPLNAANTWTQPNIISAAGASATPGLSMTGSWLANANVAQLLVGPTSAGAFAGSANGTGIGINADGSFSGNAFDFQVAGSSRFSILSSGSVTMRNVGFFGWASRGQLTSPGAGAIQLGGTDSATAVAQILQAQSIIAGTSNVAGQAMNVIGSRSTGSGASGDMIFSVGGTGAGAAVQNAALVGLTLKAGTAATGNPSVVLGNAALATNATDGFLYLSSGAGTPTGTPTSFTGRVALYVDTTNSQLWMFLGGAWKQPKTPAGAALVTWQ